MTDDTPLRKWLRRNVPQTGRKMFEDLRQKLRRPPIDSVVLFDFPISFVEELKPRLTLVLPRLAAGSDFGGFATGIDVFSRLFVALSQSMQIDLRVIITDVISETDPSIVSKWAAKAGLVVHDSQIELVKTDNHVIAVRPNEMFVTYNWWTTLNFAKVRNAQADHFGKARTPMIWLMQDYEPAFEPFSSAHMLARAAYDTSAPLWGVINSSNLAQYIEAVGHRLDRSFVFEPVISEALRPYLDQVAASARGKRVLVYGRPTVERNCFPALVRGLRRWARDYPEYADWEVISAGVEHDPVDLGDGRMLTSVGKLSLDAYAEMLLSCSAGVSLMASPHPSYPPLEMVHFGLQTVTNGYFCKDLTAFHPNIISAPSIAETDLAAALAEACRRSATPPGPQQNAGYVRTETYPFMPALTDALRAALSGQIA